MRHALHKRTMGSNKGRMAPFAPLGTSVVSLRHGHDTRRQPRAQREPLILRPARITWRYPDPDRHIRAPDMVQATLRGSQLGTPDAKHITCLGGDLETTSARQSQPI